MSMSKRSASGTAVVFGLTLAAAMTPGAVSAQAPAQTATAPAQATGAPAQAPTASAAAIRWTAETPDEMVDQALKRAQAGGDDALAGLVIVSMLDDRAAFGKARGGLDAIGAGTSPLAD